MRIDIFSGFAPADKNKDEKERTGTERERERDCRRGQA